MRKYLFGLALIGAFSLGMPLAANAATLKIGVTSCLAAAAFYGVANPVISKTSGFTTASYANSPWSGGAEYSPSPVTWNLYCYKNGTYAGAADVSPSNQLGGGSAN